MCVISFSFCRCLKCIISSMSAMVVSCKALEQHWSTILQLQSSVVLDRVCECATSISSLPLFERTFGVPGTSAQLLQHWLQSRQSQHFQTLLFKHFKHWRCDMQKLCTSHVKANDLRICRWLQMLQSGFVKACMLWFFQPGLGCSHRPSRGEFRHSRWWGGAGKGPVWCGLVVWTTQYCIHVMVESFYECAFLFTGFYVFSF